jgi:hypothetical protein
MPQAQPLDKRTDRSSEPTRPPSWIERTRATAQPAYDLQVCPPALRGQQVLFRLPRQLTDAHTRGISGRDLRDNPLVQTTAAAYAAERHYSPEWQRWVCRMLGLALAIRDADGDDLVCEEALDDLPHFADAAAEVLRRAGLLRPRPTHRPAATAPQPRSCRHCGSWGAATPGRRWRDRVDRRGRLPEDARTSDRCRVNECASVRAPLPHPMTPRVTAVQPGSGVLRRGVPWGAVVGCCWRSAGGLTRSLRPTAWPLACHPSAPIVRHGDPATATIKPVLAGASLHYARLERGDPRNRDPPGSQCRPTRGVVDCWPTWDEWLRSLDERDRAAALVLRNRLAALGPRTLNRGPARRSVKESRSRFGS